MLVSPLRRGLLQRPLNALLQIILGLILIIALSLAQIDMFLQDFLRMAV